jgi:hypothetical protein
VLPAAFDVTGLATASVAAATLAAAEFLAARAQSAPREVTVDSQAACAAFAAEGLFTPIGWSRPEIWDPIAGNYQASDGWIRLHTNYAYHRAVVERLLGAGDRDGVQAAVRRWKAADLETAVVEEGGCAAAMRDRDAWLASPQGAATAGVSAVTVTERPVPAGAHDGLSTGGGPPDSLTSGGPTVGGLTGGGRSADGGAERPFGGVRVLDLARVIAGPVCTRFLAAYGAEVLRVDPSGFAEVPALLPETTAGKRAAALDLRAVGDRTVFENLIRGADVLVTGLRADALARLGYGDDALTALNPALIHASLNAYGWDGPWRNRRGFDSLVQMSCGIAAAGAEAGGSGTLGSGTAGSGTAGSEAPDRDKPVPLPVQALDHGCGYLLAAAVGRALARRHTDLVTARIRASLTGTANLLWSLPRPAGQPPRPGPGDFTLTDASTAWGPARRAPVAGRIAGADPRLVIEAGPLGRHRPAWEETAPGR